MKNYHETGTPWHLDLLEYLCTPLDDKTPSPSSLIGHQFKGLCPTFSSSQESQEGTLQHLIERCLHEKMYHDKKSRTLADIPTGCNAAVLDHRSNTWTVRNILAVKLPNGKIIHYNRADLRPTSVQFQPISAIPVSLPAVTPNGEPSTINKPPNTDSLTVSQPPKAPSLSKSCPNTVMESQPRVARPASKVKDAVVTTRSG